MSLITCPWYLGLGLGLQCALQSVGLGLRVLDGVAKPEAGPKGMSHDQDTVDSLRTPPPLDGVNVPVFCLLGAAA